ncbi:MAG: Uma2 family endonuclease [Bacteroidia bacterium]|nr:Uma2 family endonuclease [Bacteroidia bacterium]
MIVDKGSRRTLPRISPKKIPAALIYETLDGRPIYYKGYRDVLNQLQSIEDVMGSSNLQATIIEYFLMILYRTLNLNQYRILTNEVGLHLEKNSNLSGDILIFDKTSLPIKSADKYYISVPPKIQIEVDVKAEMEDLVAQESYVYSKTQKLLNFGVEKIIWVLSDNKKVLVATPNADWSIADWHKEIEIMEGIGFCIGKYLREEGSPFA